MNCTVRYVWEFLPVQKRWDKVPQYMDHSFYSIRLNVDTFSANFAFHPGYASIKHARWIENSLARTIIGPILSTRCRVNTVTSPFLSWTMFVMCVIVSDRIDCRNGSIHWPYNRDRTLKNSIGKMAAGSKLSFVWDSTIPFAHMLYKKNSKPDTMLRNGLDSCEPNRVDWTIGILYVAWWCEV